MRTSAERSTSLRTLIVELRPAALDEYGAGAAIESLAERTATRQGIDVDVHLDLAWERGEQPTRHTPDFESTLYRLVQESLTNAVRHAGASRVEIDVTERDGSLDASTPLAATRPSSPPRRSSPGTRASASSSSSARASPSSHSATRSPCHGSARPAGIRHRVAGQTPR